MTTLEVPEESTETATLEPNRTTEGGRSTQIWPLDFSFESHLFSHYRDWLQLFQRDREALICQHPDFVSREVAHSEQGAKRAAFLVESSVGRKSTRQYDYPDQTASDAAITDVGMGVLIPKDIHTKQLGVLGPDCTLRGFRLGGNRFLGDQSQEIQSELLQAILGSLRELRADFLLVEDLIEGSPLWKLCHSQASRNHRVYLPRAVQTRLRIRFPADPKEYWSKFNSKRRYHFRDKVKKFGNHELVRITEVDQVAEFLEHAHYISQRSWQAHHLGVRVLNDERELSLLNFLALQGGLRSYLLFKDGAPTAFVLGSQFNGHFDYAETGYNREFARISPGQVLLIKLITDLIHEKTPECLDFGGGDAEYKQIFSNDIKRSGNVWLVPTDVQSKLKLSHVKAGLALNRLARAVLTRSGQFKRVRQWIRAGKSAG